MADDPAVAPVVPDPAAAAPIVPAADVPDPAASPAPVAAIPEPAAATIPDSVFGRIDRLTKDKKIAEESAFKLSERLRAAGFDPETGLPLQQQPQAGGGTAPAAQPVLAMPAEEIERRASALASEREFTSRCNELASKGEAAHADFAMKMSQLNALGVMNPMLVTATLEIGDSHEILYALASDLNEAARISALSPASQAVALVKFNEGRKTKAAATISKAPPPPADGVDTPSPANDTTPSPKDKSEDWFRKRELQTGIKSGNYG